MESKIIGQGIYDDNLQNHIVNIINNSDIVSCEALMAFMTLNGLLRIGIGENGPLNNFIINPSTRFNLLVGIDNITTADALSRLKEFDDLDIPNYNISGFSSHGKGIFHPKIFVFRKKDDTGTVIVGSNNLTQGGLFSNIEVSVKLENLTNEELIEWENLIKDTYEYLNENIFEITEDLINKIKETRKQQRKSKRKTVSKTSQKISSVDLLEKEDVEIEQKNTVLIRQVPRAGNRSKQVHFTIDIVENYFNISEETSISLQQVQPNKKPEPVETRPLVLSDVNRNAKIEINGAEILNDNYPEDGSRPILVFEKIDESFFRYMLLLKENDGFEELEGYLESLPKGRALPYEIMDLDKLLDIWSDYPV
ncbi:MAG: hypothetical protein ACOCRX_09240 [Candidatus Woesearchaeota archaeon]